VVVWHGVWEVGRQGGRGGVAGGTWEEVAVEGAVGHKLVDQHPVVPVAGSIRRGAPGWCAASSSGT